MKILLTVSYDGTNYKGWQRQLNGMTIQECLDVALSKIFTKIIVVTGSSRTDAGVHALGQRVTFRIDELKIPINKLAQVVNRHLADDIVVRSAEIVPDEYHPRTSVKEKKYRYIINNDTYPNPLLRNHTWFVAKGLDVGKMQEAAQYMLGTHDFTTFCSAGTTVKSKVRTIFKLDVKKDGNLIVIEITGNGFLYNMVRIIAGTLVAVGRGKIQPNCIEDIIKACDRTKADRTAPPQGLTLLS